MAVTHIPIPPFPLKPTDVVRPILHHPLIPMFPKNKPRALGAAWLALSAVAAPLFGADAPTAPAAAAAAPAPAAASANTQKGNRGAPASPDELAEMAKLRELPVLTPQAGNGDYLIKPPFVAAPEQTPRADVPKGKIQRFTLNAADSKFYPGTGMRDAKPSREITVYIPNQYVAGTPAPFIVTHDAYGARNDQLPTILDNMIADRRLPAMIAIMVPSGGGDGRGSERGLEYDTVSGKYAEFIQAEVLPVVERNYGVTLTQDPAGRATMGGSSGAAVAFTMAWFHPEWYRRVLSYSGTYTNNQSPENPASPHGAWEYHENWIPQTAPKPLRVWLHVSENDNGARNSPTAMRNWVSANQRMASVLKTKGYAYQFVYSVASGHTDRNVIAATLPHALEWLWQGYQPSKK
jgi:enterochelin esterase-like enzyme